MCPTAVALRGRACGTRSIVDDTGSDPNDPNGPPRPDANNNERVCWNMEKNIVTDDHEGAQDPCPPGFLQVLEQVPPGG